jgi:hypothetical protein
MNAEKESDLFNEAFTDPYLYIYKSKHNYCIVHYCSKNPFKIKTIESSDCLDEIIKNGIDHSKKIGILFIKNIIYE